MADVPISTILPAYQATAAPGARSPVEEEVVALFDQFRERLLRYLLGFGLAAPDAEEVIQDVFLSLFLHLQQGKSRDNLRGWLFRVGHNLALKRRQRDRAGSLTELAADQQTAGLVDPAPGPEDQVLASHVQKRLLAAYRALPERDRRCLWLRAEGLNYREIAGVLEISLGAVALSLARSLARMERCAKR
ncbi:MAG TPA: sigma-70 family RNA polymerase sigma factor [Bryobacteraceae bacterium]|nr:sigma-70 family RNA polymerase sigma factor [Bryobacteraceae bacterium]